MSFSTYLPIYLSILCLIIYILSNYIHGEYYPADAPLQGFLLLPQVLVVTPGQAVIAQVSNLSHLGQPDYSPVAVTLFGLFAEIERELISMRTKEALAAARASGKRRPFG